MLSKKEIICPEQLLKLAKAKGPVKVVIVNAGKAVSIESTKQAVDEGLIDPIFVGDKNVIEKLASEIKWNISNYKIVKVNYDCVEIVLANESESKAVPIVLNLGQMR